MFETFFSRMRQRIGPKSPPPPVPFPDRFNRTAILVVHGMGAQKPFTTLDQFGRGLMAMFGGNKHVQQKICFRHQAANPINKQADWTQAFLRITPAGVPEVDTGRVVDVFEYYWAPAINDLVTAKQSLRFLIFSALTPFQYLRDNLILMNQIGRKSTSQNSYQAFLILLREFVRMLFIFLPLITVFGMLYGLVASPIIRLATPTTHTDALALTFFCHWPLCHSEIVSLVLAGLRWLFLAMSGLFLFEEFFPGHDGKTTSTSSGLYRAFIIGLFTVLLFGPLLRSLLPTHLGRYFETGGLMLVIAVFVFSEVAHDAVKRAWAAIWRHRYLILFLVVTAGLGACFHHFWPTLQHAVRAWIHMRILAPLSFVHWYKVREYALLVVLLFFVNRFLTTAIGGLAVYLGADDLSKNYAARTQILHECTESLLKLLGRADDLGHNGRDPRYDRVIIAAHSLGSVISYDTLNQLIVRREASDPALAGVDLDKIKGMLTFGCPLNKVIYFFRARTSRSTTILERILFVLHPFRLKVPISNDANGPIKIPHPYPASPPFGGKEGFHWLNAYSPFDLISGKMFFYQADDNKRIERGVMPWTAHLSYWENPELYNYFAKLL